MSRMTKRLIYCVCSVLTGSIALLLSHKTDWFGEWYAMHIYPVFPDTVGRVFSLLPFSVFEILILVAAAFAAIYLVYLLALLIVPKLRRGLKKALARAGFTLLVFVCTLFLISTLTCTVHYGRDTFADLTGMEMVEPSKDGLLALCELLIEDIRVVIEEGEAPPEEADGPAEAAAPDMRNETAPDMRNEAREAMKRLGSDTPVLSGYYPKPKSILFSKFMSRLSLTGIYSPFTIEANYNVDAPEFTIPYTMCHELAHLKGFLREDEAGFIAYLACRGSDSREFRYSGAISALVYALSVLRSEASPEEYVEIITLLPERAAGDLIRRNTYWRQYQGKASEMANKANDIYLKANSQEGGVKSYGRMVDLLLAEYRLSVL